MNKLESTRSFSLIPNAAVAADAAPRRAFQRCRSVLRRPLLSALLVLTAQGALPPTSALAQSAATAVAAARDPALVNINTASAAELAEGLNGIGASKAEAIVRYREQFGPFESLEELSEVTGVGDSTVEKNRDVISIR